MIGYINIMIKFEIYKKKLTLWLSAPTGQRIEFYEKKLILWLVMLILLLS